MNGSQVMRKVRILVAEDNREMRLIVVEALEKDGYSVEEVADGREVLARLTLDELQDRELDLIVSDVRMPGVTGFQVLETIRASKRTIPVILMTAFGDAEMRDRATKLDAIMLEKPFSLLDLRAAITLILARHR